MSATPSMYLIVLPLVFLASLVDSISGGGGLISLPAYEMAGLDYNFASGCNKFSSFFGQVSATWRYARSGKLNWKAAGRAMAAALLGSWLGTRLAMRLGSGFMDRYMVFAIPITGLIVLFNRNVRTQSRPMTRRDLLLCWPIGFSMGFYDGFFGPGMGTFLILLFSFGTGMDFVAASAASKPVNLASNLSSVLTRIAAGHVLYPLAVPAVFCSILGGWLGSKLALLRGARFVRYVMLGVLALLTARLAFNLIG